MNFSYNGAHRNAPTEFTELDKFANKTCTREVNDLQAVLDAIENGAVLQAPVDADRVGLLGHSRGGGTVIHKTARDDRIQALVT